VFGKANSFNFAEASVPGCKERGVRRSDQSYVSDERCSSRAQEPLPEGNGHFWPLSASFFLDVHKARQRHHSLKLAQNCQFKIEVVNFTEH
jgi:hypothetical protein